MTPRSSHYLRPSVPGYEDARRIWNAMIDRRPAMIARCSTTADVAAAVRHARDGDWRISVRGGGHNVAGTAVCDGGLAVDLLNEVYRRGCGNPRGHGRAWLVMGRVRQLHHFTRIGHNRRAGIAHGNRRADAGRRLGLLNGFVRGCVRQPSVRPSCHRKWNCRRDERTTTPRFVLGLAGRRRQLWNRDLPSATNFIQ